MGQWDNGTRAGLPHETVLFAIAFVDVGFDRAILWKKLETDLSQGM
jgi:hypothetical protein